MYYCLECTNKILMHEHIGEDDVDTKVLFCKNCGRTLPCVIHIKNRSAVAKLNGLAYIEFEKMCLLELIERWDDPDFQEEKSIYMSAVGKKSKEKEKHYYLK